MDDRRLKEYAFKIYSGDSDYSLQKAFRLFPKYYPKIVFYYIKIKTEKQNEMLMKMIQALGIDKGRALLNELIDLNVKMLKFYVNTSFKFNESYKKLEAATDEDRYNVMKTEAATTEQILKDSIGFYDKSCDLLDKIYNEAKKYDFGKLVNKIDQAKRMNVQGNNELSKLNLKFVEYLVKYKYKGV